MEFIDTQIISYKYKNNTELFDGDIKGTFISSLVALEFLGIMEKNENKAKMYPFRIKKVHSELFEKIEHKKEGLELGKNSTDRLIIDFNGEFESIVFYSNEAISHLINEKELDVLLLFARNTLEKDEYKKFKERARFLVDNNITVVPVTKEIILLMHNIYEDIKKEYNVKTNFRNSFVDLLILATAIEKRGKLISKDGELNKALKKCCDYLLITNKENGTTYIECCEVSKNKINRNDNKNYINNSWKILLRKGTLI